ncbi:MAG: tetratricopeptide repeat protein, partial [Acidobacteriota bacterium]
GDELVAEHQVERALKEYAQAADLAPGVVELRYWEAVALAASGHLDRALPIFKEVFSKERRWVTLTPRLVKAGQLPDDPALLKRILDQAPEAKS